MFRFLSSFTLTAGLMCLVSLAACSSASSQRPAKIGMANPASVYCLDQKGTLERRTDSKGNEIGYCRLRSGRMVEEWDFFRKNHQ